MDFRLVLVSCAASLGMSSLVHANADEPGGAPIDLGFEISLDGPFVSPIVGGAPVSSHPAVAALVSFDAQDQPVQICSGTLITPTTILTAAHCVDNVNGNEVGYLAYFGRDVVTALQTGSEPGYIFHSTAASVQPHPEWTRDISAGNDIGLMTLRDPVPLAPLPIRTAALTGGDVGTPLELIGWGRTGDDNEDSGLKRGVQSQLLELQPFLLRVGGGQTNICNGDSGGPAFMQDGGAQVVVGVASFGQGGCNGAGFSTRVDRHIGFITGAGPNPGGPGGGGTGDFGTDCQDNIECASGVCATDGASPPFCSELCSIAVPCPNGFECSPTTGEEFVCMPSGDDGGFGGRRDDAGCSSTGAGGTRGGAALVIGLICLAMMRRRRSSERAH